MTAQIDIVIVNWNAGTQLRDCVDSINQCNHFLVAKIIVVDNGSTDGSEEFIDKLSNVTLIRTGENLGFGKACNLGAAQADSEFILFLNPDAKIYANTLPNTLNFMLDPANVNVGICGVQLIDENNQIARSCARFPSALGFIVHAIGLDRIVPRFGHFMKEWDHAATRHVDQVMGAFFMVRRSLFNDLAGFDERFFVYFEEVDFSRRAKMLGYDSVYLASAQAYHAGGGTSRQIKAKRLFYSLRSRIYYAFKHFSIINASVVLLVTLFVEPIFRSLLAIWRRSLASMNETWLGYQMLFTSLPETLSKAVSCKK